MPKTLTLTKFWIALVLLPSPLHLKALQRDELLPAIGTDKHLCQKLENIKKMPFEEEHIDDPTYNVFITSGKAAVPCLIAQLTNIQRMHDPRSEPVAGDFRVGDLAFFLLLKITRADYDTILPPGVRSRAKEHGVYAYFSYVRTVAHRRVMQRRWSKWATTNGWLPVKNLAQL